MSQTTIDYIVCIQEMFEHFPQFKIIEQLEQKILLYWLFCCTIFFIFCYFPYRNVLKIRKKPKSMGLFLVELKAYNLSELLRKYFLRKGFQHFQKNYFVELLWTNLW